jgi:hypothetical protein
MPPWAREIQSSNGLTLTSFALRLALGADAVADSPRKESSGILSDEIGYTTCRNAAY